MATKTYTRDDVLQLMSAAFREGERTGADGWSDYEDCYGMDRLLDETDAENDAETASESSEGGGE